MCFFYRDVFFGSDSKLNPTNVTNTALQIQVIEILCPQLSIINLLWYFPFFLSQRKKKDSLKKLAPKYLHIFFGSQNKMWTPKKKPSDSEAILYSTRSEYSKECTY